LRTDSRFGRRSIENTDAAALESGGSNDDGKEKGATVRERTDDRVNARPPFDRHVLDRRRLASRARAVEGDHD
jgi:hypothetical protein